MNEENRIINPTTLHETEIRRKGSSFPFFCYNLDFGKTESELVPLHWHNEMEIFFTEAYGSVFINDMEYEVVPGDIIFINSGLLHRTYRKTEGNMYHIVFDLRILMNRTFETDINILIDELLTRRSQVIANPERDGALYSKFLPIISTLITYIELPNPSVNESCRITSALFSLLSVFFEENCFVNVDKSKLFGINYITSIMSFIDENYKYPIVVREIAEHTGLSETYIYSLFRDYVGATPVNYINSVRIREACRLLENGMNVTETAAEVGFINVSYFIKLFRNTTGVTPRQWQKKRSY